MWTGGGGGHVAASCLQCSETILCFVFRGQIADFGSGEGSCSQWQLCFAYVLLLIQGVTASAALGVGHGVSNGVGNITAVVAVNPARSEFPLNNLKNA